jgi:hypothetical protein
MSGTKRTKLFIFTDRETDRILFVKKSLGPDFFLTGDEWNCHELSSTTLPAPAFGAGACWHPERGMRPGRKLAGVELARVNLLRRKLEILTSVRGTLYITWSQLNAKIGAERFPMDRLAPRPTVKLLALFRRERRSMKNKLRAFFADLEARIAVIESLDELEEFFESLRENVTLGAYAALR